MSRSRPARWWPGSDGGIELSAPARTGPGLAVEMRGITKRFGELAANDRVDFSVAPGEVHALLGENGAGKTTLMRILYGLTVPDEGQINLDGQPVEVRSPRHAIDLGVGMVTQHFSLVGPMTVAENVVLGNTGGFRFHPQEARERVAAAARRLGIGADPAAVVERLSVGERQRVEILKALDRDCRLLILDEPTAVLVPQEVHALFATIEQLRAGGLSVVFISHKLREVMEASDRITVLRRGRVVGTVDPSETSERELASMMVGRPTFGVEAAARAVSRAVVLRVDRLSARSIEGLPVLREISFQVRAGEVLG
ncbi:MAG: ATP-binding cassette domain-containing protein, partial [Actinomycetota bacterium]|nr:ATP-binding cassette domain-containing protein [Actinomycetota bacterium]